MYILPSHWSAPQQQFPPRKNRVCRYAFCVRINCVPFYVLFRGLMHCSGSGQWYTPYIVDFKIAVHHQKKSREWQQSSAVAAIAGVDSNRRGWQQSQGIGIIGEQSGKMAVIIDADSNRRKWQESSTSNRRKWHQSSAMDSNWRERQ